MIQWHGRTQGPQKYIWILLGTQGTFRYSRSAEVHLDSFRYSRYFQVLSGTQGTQKYGSGFFSGEMARVAELVSASAPAIAFQYCQFAACAANTLTVVRHLSFNCHHTVSPKINFLLLGFWFKFETNPLKVTICSDISLRDLNPC